MSGCGPSAVSNFNDGTFLVTCYDDNSIAQIDAQGQFLTKVSWSNITNVGFQGPNDFALDCFGGVYFTASGVWDIDPPATGAVFYIQKPQDILIGEGDVYQVTGGIHYANGAAVIDNGQTLLVGATLDNTIYQYGIGIDANSGQFGLSPGKVFADLNIVAPQPDLVGGYMGPDGMRLVDGVLYQAQFGGARVLKFKESGELIGSVSFTTPFRNNTNVWVDGDALYTTALTEIDLPTGNLYPGVVVKIVDPELQTRK
ncbi:hypothetical protein HDU98_002543, partial [Podochytrium sp. JEL0797]